MPATKRISKVIAIAWVCLVVFVAIVRGLSIELGAIKPEAVALIFMMTLPITLGATVLVIGITWLWERRRTS